MKIMMTTPLIMVTMTTMSEFLDFNVPSTALRHLRAATTKTEMIMKVIVVVVIMMMVFLPE